MSTTRRGPPFRAEHLGSLLRPESLLEKRREVQHDKITKVELQSVEDQAINEVVDMQQSVGLQPISDGEYRRHMFFGTFLPSLRGMREIQNPPWEMFRTYNPSISAYIESGVKPGETVVCDGKILHSGSSENVEQFEYLKKILPRERWCDIKFTVIAPEWYHFRLAEGKAYPKEVYRNDEEYFTDLAAAYRQELKILYDAGLRNVQIDDPSLCYFCSPAMRAGWASDPTNTKTADEMLASYITLHNACLADRSRDMHAGLHVCRGNFAKSKHFSSGSYDAIAATLFTQLQVDTFYLEYDTPRAGSFEPLALMPQDKNVVLGLVTSKFPELEDKGRLVARVWEAAGYVAKGAGEGGVEGRGRIEALRRMGVSPQCRFASHEEGNALGYEDMVRKLRLVRSVADEIWPGEP